MNPYIRKLIQQLTAQPGEFLLNPQALRNMVSPSFAWDPSQWLPLDVWYRGTGTRGPSALPSMDFNTYLGKHFSAIPQVANTFAEKASEGGQVLAAKIRSLNPRVVGSENLLDTEALILASRLKLLSPRNFVGSPSVPSQALANIETKDLSQPMWEDMVNDLNLPTRIRLGREYKKLLQQQGYDSIIYGNEFEGTKQHPSAIVFDPDSQLVPAFGSTHPIGSLIREKLQGHKLPPEVYASIPSLRDINPRKAIRTSMGNMMQDAREYENRRTLVPIVERAVWVPTRVPPPDINEIVKHALSQLNQGNMRSGYNTYRYDIAPELASASKRYNAALGYLVNDRIMPSLSDLSSIPQLLPMLHSDIVKRVVEFYRNRYTVPPPPIPTPATFSNLQNYQNSMMGWLSP